MMKKLALVFVLVVALAASAGAYDGKNYIWNIAATDTAGGNAGATNTLGQFSPTGTAAQSWPTATLAYVGNVKYTGGLNESMVKTDVLKKDFQAAPSTDNWILVAWAGNDFAGTTFDLRIWAATAATTKPEGVWTLNKLYDPITNVWERVELGQIDTATKVTNGSSSSPWLKVNLATAKAADPLLANKGYILELTSVPIPEPGSMVAMLSGLVGLVGFGIRRRR